MFTQKPHLLRKEMDRETESFILDEEITMSQSKTINRKIVLNTRPVGALTTENFRLEETIIPKPGLRQILLKNLVPFT
jgi:hypothetical protein